MNLFESDLAYDAFKKLKSKNIITDDDCKKISQNDQIYLLAENCIRNAKYSELDLLLKRYNNKEMISFAKCYRDLFVNPKKSLNYLSKIDLESATSNNLNVRMLFWKADALYLIGKNNEADIVLNHALATMPSDYLWKAESLAIAALGHFFSGRTSKSLEFHFQCQKEIDLNSDVFFQSFNSSMATRVALKLCDSEAFEFFSKKLDESLDVAFDTRYRLRNISYRALIFNQLGEHEAAEAHWINGDKIVESTESALEKGHYQLYRGLSLSLQGLHKKANIHYKKSKAHYILAGSQPVFLAELDVSQQLSLLSCPKFRSNSIKKSEKTILKCINYFRIKSKNKNPQVQKIYKDGIKFSSEILFGKVPCVREKELSSVSLSIIDNVSRSKTFASGLATFNLTSNFIAALSQFEHSENSISLALNKVFNINPILDDDGFRFPREFYSIQDRPEIKNLLSFASILHKLNSKANLYEKTKSQEKISKLAAQVSHDIRSPLAALEMICSTLDTLPEEKRLIIRNSVLRIRDIANDLLSERRNANEINLISLKSDVLLNKKSILLGPIIESIVSEKRIQFSHLMNVGIEFNQNASNYGYFSLIESSEFKRVISNLINNSLEAIDSKDGKVEISLFQCDSNQDFICIDIKDNGRGIPDNILSRLGKEAITFGKTNGNGLGFSHAFHKIKEWGGDIEVFSKVNFGTLIRIKLKKAQPPKWFTPFIDLKNKKNIVIFDDDISIHQVWTQRFKDFDKCFSVTHFTSPNEIRSYFRKNFLDIDQTLFLIDYEIKNTNETGIDLINELGINSQSVLVTSRFEDKTVKDNCEQIGTLLLPKNMSGFIPMLL